MSLKSPIESNGRYRHLAIGVSFFPQIFPPSINGIDIKNSEKDVFSTYLDTHVYLLEGGCDKLNVNST